MIAARIREHALRTPERVAIDAGGRRVTYAELDARARAIAGHVRAAGLGRDDVIAIESDDRATIACGMVGVWYAGAAFMVVTSDVPSARAARMKSDANARLGIDDALISSAPDVEAVPREVGEDDLAYVVFTSGTTGTPKGVLVTHAGLLPMLDAQIDAFQIDATARCAWLLSPLFDASISDVGTALVAGATLVVERDLARSSPRALFERLGELGVTHVDLPPSVLALLDGAPPPSLRTIVIGGEACAEHVVRRVAAQLRLVNVYGPTEATVCTSLQVCRAAERHGARIGMPLPHVVYRVEEEELLIGGPCLARGYAGDPSLDEKRFVWRDGTRFYRTGDRVRARDASGELEITGRIDRQVKVAGVRIEPEEIEARLRGDPSVLDVAVVPRGRVLHAFVVTRADIETIRERLVASVPRWLVPARMTAVGSLPRTPTGKVDFASLASRCEPVAEDLPDDRTGAVCEALASALGRATFGVDDDFVDAGGDSLAVLEACAVADERGLFLSPETITSERTARRIVASRDVAGMSVADLEADIASIVGEPLESARDVPRAVFVTGATGTLGASLVRSLVDRGCTVTCLVRARDDEQARARLGAMPSGVRAVAGDVTLDNFGLPAARFRALAREHDAIVHAAADLRLTASYAALRATNVLGAARALEFAREGTPKRVHHVSTLSVFASSALARSGRTFHDGDALRDSRVLYGGYAQTKWAAEALVRRVAPDACVTRLGLLLPSRRRDLFGAFVRAAATLGCLPDDPDLAFDVTPVEFAAHAIARLVTAEAPPRVVHVANRAPARLEDLSRAMGASDVRVELVPVDRFRARVLARRDTLDPLALAVVRALGGDPEARAFDLFEATTVDLGTSTPDCPPASEVLASCVRVALERGAP